MRVSAVDFAVPAAPRVTKAPERKRLDRAWAQARSGFLGGLRWLLSVSGAALFALLIAVAALFGSRAFLRHVVPRLRRFFI